MCIIVQILSVFIDRFETFFKKMFLCLEKWDQEEIYFMVFLYDLAQENLRGNTNQNL